MPQVLGIEIQVCRAASPSIRSFPLPPVNTSEPAPPTRMSPTSHEHLALAVAGSNAVKDPSENTVVQSAARRELSTAVPAPLVVRAVPARVSLPSPPDNPSISWN